VGSGKWEVGSGGKQSITGFLRLDWQTFRTTFTNISSGVNLDAREDAAKMREKAGEKG